MNTPSSLPRKRPAWKTPLLVIAVLIILLIVAAGTALWWWTRPIEATVLTAAEQQVVEQKLEAVESGTAGAPAEAPYTPGAKVIILTEREINGLLEMHGLGDRVRIDLATDAIHARVSTDLDPSIPVIGGKTLRAKARVLVKNDKGTPAVILDDLTIWGVSLPNAWLADIKGRNLIEFAADGIGHNAIADGIDELRISPGQITLNLAE
jgi:hypothetical protein